MRGGVVLGYGMAWRWPVRGVIGPERVVDMLYTSVYKRSFNAAVLYGQHIAA